jgi:hypothetical protein
MRLDRIEQSIARERLADDIDRQAKRARRVRDNRPEARNRLAGCRTYHRVGTAERIDKRLDRARTRKRHHMGDSDFRCQFVIACWNRLVSRYNGYAQPSIFEHLRQHVATRLRAKY